MTSAWWEHLGEALKEAAEYVADQEPTTADYLSRAAWMVRAVAEEQGAEELRCRDGGSGSRRVGSRPRSGCWRAPW
jgi:hypothetical protein